LEFEKLAMRLGAHCIRGGFRDGQINHRLRQILVKRDIPIRVVLFSKGFEANGLQLVEGGEALPRGVCVIGVAEGAEGVGVLVARRNGRTIG
jgi:hypothetical protein